MERKLISTGRGLDFQFAYGLIHSPRLTVRRSSEPNKHSHVASRAIAISILGSAGCGKSTLIAALSEKSTRLNRSSPSKSTSPNRSDVVSTTVLESVDGDDTIQCLLVEGKAAKYSDTQAAVIAFDLNDRQSFCNAQVEWRNLMALFDEEKQPRCILVGTKADASSRRKVTASEARELASSLKCHYVETSELDKQSFDQALCQLVSTVVERRPLLLAMDQVVSHTQLPSMTNKMNQVDAKQKEKKKSNFGLKMASLLRKSITGI
jgi:GTPase SAR1 family protein